MNQSIFQHLASLFKKHSVQPVLVGGYAIIAHKVQRMTFDIDFMITADDFQKIESELICCGYSVLNQSDAFIQLKGEAPGFRDLDFLITDKETIQGLKASGQRIVIAGEEFTVPSIMHIIAMKLHAISYDKEREQKDFLDIQQLLALNSISPDTPELRKIFSKYGVKNLYEKLKKNES